MPKISIIIPCYNVEKYIHRCLDSVIKQTFSDWEAICVDDGSPDNCGKILDEYAKKYPRIKRVANDFSLISSKVNNAHKKIIDISDISGVYIGTAEMRLNQISF